MDIADRYGLDLRLWLRSAERIKEAAMLRALLRVKTPFSRVSASLVSVTRCDQRCLRAVAIFACPSFDVLTE